jgi:hypothetical protein
MRSIVNIEKKRGRGRPPTEATPVLVRVMPDQLEKLDAWIKRHDDKLGRPEAIRRLLDQALAAARKRRPAKRKEGP